MYIYIYMYIDIVNSQTCNHLPVGVNQPWVLSQFWPCLPRGNMTSTDVYHGPFPLKSPWGGFVARRVPGRKQGAPGALWAIGVAFRGSIQVVIQYQLVVHWRGHSILFNCCRSLPLLDAQSTLVAELCAPQVLPGNTIQSGGWQFLE